MEELLDVLKSEGHYRATSRLARKMEGVLEQTIRPRKREKSLVVLQEGSEHNRTPLIVGMAYALASSRLFSTVRVIKWRKGEVIDPSAILESDVTLLALEEKAKHMLGRGVGYRQFLKEHGKRFASTTSLATLGHDKIRALEKALTPDYEEMRETAKSLAKRIEKEDRIIVESENGTRLLVDKKGKPVSINTGEYDKPGTGGNLPAGEVYFPPRGKRVWGRVVIDESSRNMDETVLVDEPFEIRVNNGKCRILGKSVAAERLRESLARAKRMSRYDWGVRRLGEIGIGINPKASVVGSMIIDEKTLGTGHVAIGSNHWFGGTIYSIIHLDQVFSGIMVYAGKERLW